ncbi:hypothetical protein ACFSQ7_25240 [Paenibacillus rhizoplanae]
MASGAAGLIKTALALKHRKNSGQPSFLRHRIPSLRSITALST